MSLDRDAMYRQFEESPGDFAGYGAMADELDTLGYAAIAHAFRWMCFRQLLPHKRTHHCGWDWKPTRAIPAKQRWAWYCEPSSKEVVVYGTYPKTHQANHGLPWMITGKKQRLFGSHQQAVMFLADQLAAMNDLYDVKPPHERRNGRPLLEVLAGEIERDGTVLDPPELNFEESRRGPV